MPPKKSAAAPPSSKAKATKRKVEEKEVLESKEDEIPGKKLKEKLVRKTKATNEEKEETEVKQKEVLEKGKRPTRKAQSKDEDTEVTIKKKKTPKEKQTEVDNEKDKKEKIVKNKKTVTDDNSGENQNGNTTKKEAKSKKTKTEKTEEAPKTSKAKKSTANKAKQTKKAEREDDAENEQDSEGISENEEAGTKKGRKRKTAPKVNKKDESGNKTAPMNATATKWENINFACTSKNSKGKTPNFHITSWNVDGLRAWLKKGGLYIVQHDQPDIFCIQETKCTSEKLPDEVKNIEGYETLWCDSEKEGYAGVGVATKVKPLSVTYGIESEEHDSEGRCITLEYERFFLVNVYVPNAGRKLVTLPKRLDWNESFKAHVKKLDERKPVIICGDMNVAHAEIDLANPKTNTKNAGFTAEEREGMTDFLKDGYVDTFRKLYPDKEKAYTFWTYMANARSKNVGWRLDYFIVSDRLMEHVCDNLIHSDVLGSDHCPVSLHINI